MAKGPPPYPPRQPAGERLAALNPTELTEDVRWLIGHVRLVRQQMEYMARDAHGTHGEPGTSWKDCSAMVCTRAAMTLDL